MGNAAFLFIYVAIFFVVTTPTISVLSRAHYPGLLWAFLITWGIITRFAFGAVFTSISLFVSNSVDKSKTATVNGLALTVTSTCRAFSPAVVGNLYAWSLHVNAFPLD